MSGYEFDYEQKVWGGETLRLNPIHFRATRLLYALSALKNVKGKVLDVGCGVGDFSESFNHYRPDLQIFAIDISKKAVALAKKRKINAVFKVADAQRLPFKDNFFDAVACFDLIEHVYSPTKVIKEIYRVLKPGGIFHTFIPTETEPISLEGPLIKLGWKGKEIYGGHPHHFSKKQVLNWMKEASFEIKKVRWGEHFVNQVLEILYFSYLSMRGRNLESTVEGYLATSKPNLKIKVLRVVKNILSTLSYYETKLLWRFPGLGLHITCTKSDRKSVNRQS